MRAHIKRKDSIDRHNIIKDASFFSGSVYIARALYFVRGFLNARFLGPELYGLWSALTIIFDYSSYLHLGSVNAMARDVPYYKGRRMEDVMVRVKNVTFTFSMVMILIFFCILIVTAFLLSGRIPFHEMLGIITVAFLSLIVFIYKFYQISHIAMKRFSIISKANLIFSFLSVIFTLALVPMFRIYGVYIVALSVSFFNLLYLWRSESSKARLDFNFRELYRLIKTGFPIMSRNFLESSITNLGGIIVLLLLGKVNMGYYSVAMVAGCFFLYLRNSVQDTLEPHIYQRYGETHDIAELKKYLFKPTLVMAFLAPVMLAFYYSGVSFLIRHFLPKYIVAVSPFFIILIGFFFICLSPTAIAFITAIDKQKFLVPVYIAGVLIMAGCGLVLIRAGFCITAVPLGIFLSLFFISTVIFIYAITHYIKSPFRCLAYFGGLCIPLLYMASVLFLSEALISGSPGFLPDMLKLFARLTVLFIFSLPLIYIADKKTNIISDILNSLRFKNPELLLKGRYFYGDRKSF